MKRSLPLGPALGGAIAFLPRAWANAWGILAVCAAILAGPVWLPHLDPQLCRWLCIPAALAATAASLAAQGALYRVGTSASAAEARRAGLGIGGFQFGLPELRVLAAGVFVALFLGAVAMALGLVFAFVLTAEGAHGLDPAGTWRAALAGDPRAVILCGLVVAGGWVLLQLAVRLSLFRAATIARGRIVSIGALSLAQGAFWSLFAGLIIVLLPSFLLGAWEGGLIGQGMVMPISSMAYGVARAVFLAGVQLPLAIGFLSYAYNRLEYGRQG